MKAQIGNKATITVQEAVEHYSLSRRKFYSLLHKPGLTFVVFYYNERSVVVKHFCNTLFDKYLSVTSFHWC